VTALNDADPAIGHRRGPFTARIERAARVTRVGPFPDIAGHIEEPVFVRPKAADRARQCVELLLADRLSVVNGKCALTGIADVQRFRQSIVMEPAGCRVGPLFVRRLAEALPCLA